MFSVCFCISDFVFFRICFVIGLFFAIWGCLEQVNIITLAVGRGYISRASWANVVGRYWAELGGSSLL